EAADGDLGRGDVVRADQVHLRARDLGGQPWDLDAARAAAGRTSAPRAAAARREGKNRDEDSQQATVEHGPIVPIPRREHAVNRRGEPPNGCPSSARDRRHRSRTSTAERKEQAAMTQTLLRSKLRAFDSTGLFFRALTKF